MERKWWHGKVAYQVYPKSFLDTNGDGIGDLRGIINKLDYLKDLGVDIVWISPVYCSPFVDQGYDISDYYNIDPCFGTMEDMDELLAEAKKRDMAVLANFREEPRTLQLEAPVKEILLTNRAYTEEEQAQAAEGVITLDGYQVIIAECQ